MTKRTMPPKLPKSFRLSDDANRLLDLIASKMGISLTALLEIAIRDFARKHGIDANSTSDSN